MKLLRLIPSLYIFAIVLAACTSTPKPQAKNLNVQNSTDAVQPADNWRGEDMSLPAPFAPKMSVSGELKVRFHPKWREFAQPEGFSYVFHWLVSSPLSKTELERELAIYFDGLMSEVAKSRNLAQGRASTVTLKMTEVGTWQGQISTWNAFSRAEPLQLNLEVQSDQCKDGRAHNTFALSQLPFSESIWSELRAESRKKAC
jgi:hypothetical protein